LRRIPRVTYKEDKEIGQKFLGEFPSDGASCNFLKNHDLHDSFLISDLDEIEKFVSNWDNAGHEFFKWNLDKKRRALLSQSKNFIFELSMLTRQHDINHKRLTTKVRFPDHVDQGVMRREDVKLDMLNRQASKIYNIHQDLVRAIRKLLNKEFNVN